MTTPVLTAWSYSRYADYERCPLFFKLKYLDKTLVDEGSAAMQRGSVIHKEAEDYTNGKLKKLPDNLKNFKAEFAQLRTMNPLVEQTWGFRKDWSWNGRDSWFGDEVWLRVKMDVHVVYDDNTGEVIDHKTGRKYGTNEEQVELFGAVAFMRTPTLTSVKIRLWYLDIADPTQNEEEFDMSAKEAIAVRKKWDKKVIPMFNDRRFAPKPNDKCRYCPASKAKGGVCVY
jgi:PD-(D/E)XK nuclease superfamily